MKEITPPSLTPSNNDLSRNLAIAIELLIRRKPQRRTINRQGERSGALPGNRWIG